MYLDDEVLSARLCAWKEGREDGLTGMHAVLHCLKNRVGKLGFGKTLHDVIYGRNQFTSMSVPSDPEFNLDPTKTTGLDLVTWNASAALAETVLNTDDDDPIKGACYYENTKTGHSPWFDRNIKGDPVDHPMTAQIMHHTFYL